MNVDPTSLSGTWFRHVPAGGDVFHEPPHPADNRWQRGAVVEALYFADSVETAWAEWYRYLAEAGLPPQQGLPRDLWRWRISLPDVADLGDNERLRSVGLPELQPTRHQWPLFQPIGEQLHLDGWPAVLSASAHAPTGRPSAYSGQPERSLGRSRCRRRRPSKNRPWFRPACAHSAGE